MRSVLFPLIVASRGVMISAKDVVVWRAFMGGANPLGKHGEEFMSADTTLPDPARFNLPQFSDLLPARDPFIGEDPVSYQGLHAGLMQTLAPLTPYECVIAENLIAIEWELLQQRRMRETAIRQGAKEAVEKAVAAQRESEHEAALEEAFEIHEAFEAEIEAGTKSAAQSEEPFDFDAVFGAEFDAESAKAEGADLAARAVSRDSAVQADAWEEIAALGLDPVSVMSEAYAKEDDRARMRYDHDGKVQQLERRRREVKRDFDALQKTRQGQAEIIDG